PSALPRADRTDSHPHRRTGPPPRPPAAPRPGNSGDRQPSRILRSEPLGGDVRADRVQRLAAPLLPGRIPDPEPPHRVRRRVRIEYLQIGVPFREVVAAGQGEFPAGAGNVVVAVLAA